MTTDCVSTSPSSKPLMDEGILNVGDFIGLKVEIGPVLVFKYYNIFIFNLVVKSKFHGKLFLKNVNLAIECLKDTMIECKVKGVRISNKGNGLDRLSWNYIKKAIVVKFGGQGYTFTICSNELRQPNRYKLLRIIKKHYDAVCGGH